MRAVKFSYPCPGGFDRQGAESRCYRSGLPRKAVIDPVEDLSSAGIGDILVADIIEPDQGQIGACLACLLDEQCRRIRKDDLIGLAFLRS